MPTGPVEKKETLVLALVTRPLNVTGMVDALSGFLLIGTIVAVGWAVRCWVSLPDNTVQVLGKLVFVVLSPCMLFDSLADADLGALFSGPLIVSSAAAVLCFVLFALLMWRHDLPTKVLGALCAGYTNAGYIGIPVATYVLGDASLVVPIVMLQLLIFIPVAMVLLEASVSGHASWRGIVGALARNPMLVTVLTGTLVALLGLRLPSVVMDPISTLGSAAVPMVLLAFGMSLSGQRVLAPGPERSAVVSAVVLKVVIMPLTAGLLGLLLGVPRETLYAVTILAALPTAQNILVYAQRFNRGFVMVRDATFLSTIGCVPVLLVIALIFHA